MRVAIAGFALESVSFLPIRTTLADFERHARYGAEVIEAHRGTNTVIGGFVRVCEAAGIEMTGIVSGDAGAAGSATDEAFAHYSDTICRGIAAAKDGLGGILLFLHGAMTTETRLDPEAEILAALRRIVGPAMPIVVALDYHGNLDAAILEHATALFGYHYSPHTDMGETGERAARCLLATLRGEMRPVTALAKPGVMVPSIFSATACEPLAGIVRRSLALPREEPGLVDVSVFAGFSYADVPNCGFSVVAVADGDHALAERVATDLAREIQARRRALYEALPVYGLAEGVARAIDRSRRARKPIVLLEHADRLNDSTHVLRELLRQKVPRAAVPCLWDPLAARQAVAAGAGAQVTLDAGGRSSPRAGGPVRLSGIVRVAGDKSYRTTGPVGRGRPVDLGPSAVIEAGGILVTLTSNPHTAIDEDCFTEFGLRAADFPIIVLRSKTHFRAVYEALAEEILIVDTPDWGPADLTGLPYRHVPRDRVFPFADLP